MTQLLAAKKGEITPEMSKVAEAERVDVETLRERIASGTVVLSLAASGKGCGQR